MPVMERRLQLLLDQDRYRLVAEEARRTGRSVAAVIREAIDLRFSSDADRRASAARRFLEMSKNSVGEDPFDLEEFKASLDEEMDHRADPLGLERP
ncbi:MAG TPA: ribbon-helix-helix protein, CopG family [Nocardioidaceae bacterium]|nr:ribbon-helix-helix protein, CopG family [Nocardioidaceae bacterium]